LERNPHFRMTIDTHYGPPLPERRDELGEHRSPLDFGYFDALVV